jgi:hypothetical protein
MHTHFVVDNAFQELEISVIATERNRDIFTDGENTREVTEARCFAVGHL